MGDKRIIEQRIPAAAGVAEARFPDSDGRFLPENDTQAEAILSVRYALTRHYSGVEDVYLAGNLFVYYDADDDAVSVAPDVFVVLGTARGRRTSYKVWEEGKPPDFVLEVISPRSKDREPTQDLVDKAGIYAAMGVREYFVYQPDPERRGYRLSGRRLWGRGYVELQPVRGPRAELELRSEVLSLAVWPVGVRLRLRDLESGRELPWPEESEAEYQQAEARARAEAARARAGRGQGAVGSGGARAGRDQGAGCRSPACGNRGEVFPSGAPTVRRQLIPPRFAAFGRTPRDTSRPRSRRQSRSGLRAGPPGEGRASAWMGPSAGRRKARSGAPGHVRIASERLRERGRSAPGRC